MPDSLIEDFFSSVVNVLKVSQLMYIRRGNGRL